MIKGNNGDEGERDAMGLLKKNGLYRAGLYK